MPRAPTGAVRPDTADGQGRRRVLFLIDNVSAAGGAERFMVGLAIHLPRDRFEVWVCSTRTAEPATVAALRSAGIRHVSCGRRAKWDVHRLWTLVGLLRSERFEVVHTHKFGSNVWGTILARACRVPVVIAHEYNWSYACDPVRIGIDRFLIARLCTRFVAVSQADRERMIILERIPAAKIVFLPLAYVPHALTPEHDIRSELGLAPGAAVITSATLLRPQKAHEVMIEAHARVVRRLGEAHLVICGDGPRQTELERQVAELGTGHLVHFLGRRHDVDAILRASDAGVMSSDWEGMPLFALECMAAGTALVATAVGGLPEIVEHGRSGLLVPLRDPVALADALVRVLSDSSFRRQIAGAARDRIDEFTIESVAARFAALYGALVDEANGSGYRGRLGSGPGQALGEEPVAGDEQAERGFAREGPAPAPR